MYTSQILQQTANRLLTNCDFNDGRRFLLDFAILLYGMHTKQIDMNALSVKEYATATRQIWQKDYKLSQLKYPFDVPFTGLDTHSMMEIRSFLAFLQNNYADIKETTSVVFVSMLEYMKQFRIIHDFITPISLANMMAQMLSPQDGASALDPTCGSGRVLNAMFSSNKSISLTGLDHDETILAIAFFNLYFSGCTDVTFIRQDFFKYSNNNNALLFDIILANPPYEDSALSTMEFVRSIVQTLKPGGRCGILVPEGFLTHTASREVVYTRQWLLFENSVQAVISLPMKIYKPYTASNSSLIILKKEKPAPGHKVFFSRLPEFTGTDAEWSDAVYIPDMQRIVSAWKHFATRGCDRFDVNDDLFWTADVHAIQTKEYILASDGYRYAEYFAPKKELEEIQRNILKKQTVLNEILECIFLEGESYASRIN